MATYQDSGPVDCTAAINKENVKGRTAIVTGGASGIGEAYVRALVGAGAYVVVADLNDKAGNAIQQELSGLTTFVRCNVTSWDDQLSVFKKAKEVSPSSSIDIVVANAGISAYDEIFFNDISTDEPEKPAMPIIDVNLTGVLLTTKLALWYFQKQNADGPKRERCLVLQSSMAGYVDLQGITQYTTSKFGVRGLMRGLRRTEGANGIRVNLIAPWYIKTPIITEVVNTAITTTDTGYATVEDAGSALLRIVSDSNVQGRAIAIMPRSWPGCQNGYRDLCQDDFVEDAWMREAQEYGLRPVGWTLSQKPEAAEADFNKV